tara:strand:+ start:845 stop:1162 length:318 start_codon:yes stop_codon:yes gene_type:complete
MFEFKHPKYYKELKKNSTLSKRSVTKNNSSHVDQEDQAALGSLPALDPQSDQAISSSSTTVEKSVRPGPGLKPQASSSKEQASSTKLQAFEPTRSIAKRQASQPE